MVNSKLFVDKTIGAIRLAMGRIIMADDPYNPYKLNFDLTKPTQHHEYDTAYKFNGHDELKPLIKYQSVILLSGLNSGFESVVFYYSDPSNIVAVEFGKCTPKFLEITERLGLVNGIEYKERFAVRGTRDHYMFVF